MYLMNDNKKQAHLSLKGEFVFIIEAKVSQTDVFKIFYIQTSTIIFR